MNVATSHTNSWILRFKLNHIPFWVLYHYLLWIVAFGNPIKAANSILSSPQIVTFTFYVVFQGLAAYFNLYFLIPRYLEKSKFLKYLILFSLALVVTTLFIVAGYYLSAFIFGVDLKNIYLNGTDCFFFFVGQAFPSTLASATLTMSIKMAKHWLDLKKRDARIVPDIQDHFFVKIGNKFERVFFQDILYIEGMQNYVTIYTSKGKHISLLNMKDLEANLQEHGFIRTHKSYIVAVNKIDSIDRKELSIGSKRIPVSRTYYKHVTANTLNPT